MINIELASFLTDVLRRALPQMTDDTACLIFDRLADSLQSLSDEELLATLKECNNGNTKVF